MATKEKVKVDYNKMDLETLAKLVADLPDDKKAAFNPQDYVEHRAKKSEMVAELDANGKPKYYIGKDGKTKIRKKKQAIGTETVEYFNLMKAKRVFYDTFKEDYEWTSKPKERTQEKKEAQKEKNTKALASLGIVLNK